MRVEIPVVVLNPVSPYNPVEDAQVSMVDRLTSLAAVVYTTSSSGTVRTQPLLTDASGRVDGWVDRGSYELEVSIPGRPVYTDYFEASPGGDSSIDTAWIEDGSITTAKLDTGAVTAAKLGTDAVTTEKIDALAVDTAEIAAGAVTTAKIEDDAVTSAKIDDSIAIVPLGTILDWFPPASASAPWSSVLPSDYALCDGSPWSDIVNDLGYSSGNIPNLVNRVTIGAVAASVRWANGTHNPVAGETTGPGVGGQAGSNTTDQSHSHTVGGHQHGMTHQHTVSSHSHYMSHTHGVYGHTHSIAGKTISHNNDNGAYNWYSRASDTGSSGSSTDAGTRTYVDSNGDASTTAVTKSETDANTAFGTTGNPSEHWDNRSLSIGVLKIMKVRNL